MFRTNSSLSNEILTRGWAKYWVEKRAVPLRTAENHSSSLHSWLPQFPSQIFHRKSLCGEHQKGITDRMSGDRVGDQNLVPRGLEVTGRETEGGITDRRVLLSEDHFVTPLASRLPPTLSFSTDWAVSIHCLVRTGGRRIHSAESRRLGQLQLAQRHRPISRKTWTDGRASFPPLGTHGAV